MGILDKLRPQPEWKHTDPAVRVAAVQQLADEEAGDLLAAIARDDIDPRVRRAAVEWLTDPHALIPIARNDPDEQVRTTATAALLDLARSSHDEAIGCLALEGLVDPRDLVELAKAVELESIGCAALARITDAKRLGTVARRADHAVIRLKALAQIRDSRELVAVALKSEHRDVAMAALDRVAGDDLYDRKTMSAIATRAKSKVVARRAKAILRDRDGLPQPPSPEDVRQQRTDLCQQLERLAQSDDLDMLASRHEDIQTAWGDLQAADLETPEAELASRFTTAGQMLQSRLEEYERRQAEQVQRRAAQAAAAAVRVALCERVEQLGVEDATSEVDATRVEWTALPADDLDPAAARALQQRFEQGCRDAERRQEQLREINAWRHRVAQSLDEIEALADTAELADIKARWSAARGGWPKLDGGLTDELRARVQAVDARLDARQAEIREAEARQRRTNLARLTQRCEQFEALTKSDSLTLKQAERGFRDLKRVFEGHVPLPTKRDREALTERLKATQKALYSKLHELREIDAWQRWANASVQEELCRRAEALREVEDPAEVARYLRECVAEWKAAAVVPRERAAALWQRFKAAHDQAYARCAAFYVQQAEERSENLKRKQALCEQVEALATSTDWIRTAAKIVGLQAEWQTIGPAPRRHVKAIWQRFRGACDLFFTRRKADLVQRKEAWTKNLEHKEALCAQAEALAESNEWTTSLAELRRLQAEWKTIGPVKKSRSEVVWQRFRVAGDRFGERYAQRDALEVAAKVAEREALCAELEALLPSADAEATRGAPDGLAEQVQAIRQRWQYAGRLPGRQTQIVTTRYHDAIERLLEAYPDSFRGTDLDPQKSRRRMEQLCERVEQLLADQEEQSAVGLSPAELLARKLREALAANTMGVREDGAARKRAAVDDMKRAQDEWKRLTPLPGESGRALTDRFRRACDQFFARRPKRASSGESQ